MDADIYQAPGANLETGTTRELEVSEFYVVSVRKFLVLSIATLGLYHVYWFYRQWRAYKQFQNADIWPVARAIFAIFTVYSLCEKIEATAHVKNPGFKWKPGITALGYIAVQVLGGALSWIAIQLAINEILAFGLTYSWLVLLPVGTWLLYRIQRAANIASGDPEGGANATLTIANWLWIVFGVFYWYFQLAPLLTAGIFMVFA